MLLFASARDAVGGRTVPFPVPASGIRADELVRALGRTYPALGRMLGSCRFVRNGRYLTDLATVVRAGDEFAVHPPYGGG